MSVTDGGMAGIVGDVAIVAVRVRVRTGKAVRADRFLATARTFSLMIGDNVPLPDGNKDRSHEVGRDSIDAV